MVVEIRLYKQYDTDLVALVDAGYSVTTMMRDAIVGYANAQPIHYLIDEFTPFDINDKKTVHSRFKIPESDVKTCYMLRNIKHRYRNSFCKAVLRNSFIQQNLTGYFADMSLAQLQNENLNGINLRAYNNVVACSALRDAPKQVTFLNKTVTVQQKKPVQKMVQNPNPFQNMGAPMQNPYGNFVNYPNAPIMNPYMQQMPGAPIMQQTPQMLQPQQIVNPQFIQSASSQKTSVQEKKPVQNNPSPIVQDEVVQNPISSKSSDAEIHNSEPPQLVDNDKLLDIFDNM